MKNRVKGMDISTLLEVENLGGGDIEITLSLAKRAKEIAVGNELSNGLL